MVTANWEILPLVNCPKDCFAFLCTKESNCWLQAVQKFISKLVEKSAAVQLTKHVRTNQLDETFHSACKEFHSTETALLRVQNHILCSLDQNKQVILLLLDLSAAFNTVDHAILISRLSNRFGVKGTALAWFKSYLTSRQQVVKVEEDMSSKQPLLRKVLRGWYWAHCCTSSTLLRLLISLKSTT